MSNKGKKRVTYYEFGFFIPRKVVRYERRKRGQQSSGIMPVLTVFTIILGGGVANTITPQIEQAYAATELVNPYVDSAFTGESTITQFEYDCLRYNKCEVEEEITYTDIEQLIVEAFPDNPKEALAIAMCESKHDPEQHGDKHLMVYDPANDEIVGDSIGLFQIRTGGKEKNGRIWNRARANGMTAEEFRVYLRDPKNNVEYAQKVYKASGSWNPWLNCKRKVL